MLKRFIYKKGMTLVEIVVVMAILAILVTLAVANYSGIKSGAEDSAITTDIATLQNIFSLSSVTNGSIGKDALAAGTIINVLSDINGDSVDPNTLKLYSINSGISRYYKKLNKNLDDYLVDASNNVYYKGLFKSIFGSLSEENLETDVGTTTEQKTITGDAITPRYIHTAVRYNNKMIIFGGYDGADKNDCYEIDLTTYVSTQKQLDGDSISPRRLHSAVIYNGKMIVFGGYNGGGTLGDCYELDLKTYDVVKKSLTGDEITPRYGHSAVVYNGKMIIFAGSNDTERFNDYYEVDLTSYIVTKKSLINGDIILTRNYHTAVVFDGKMIIFGGYNYYLGWMNDGYSIDLSTYEVTQLTATGDSISARHFHTAGVYNGKMIIFGGAPLTNTCYAVELPTCNSTQMNLVNPPSARYSHTQVMYFNKMIIFGGYDGTTLLNDCYEIR